MLLICNLYFVIFLYSVILHSSCIFFTAVCSGFWTCQVSVRVLHVQCCFRLQPTKHPSSYTALCWLLRTQQALSRGRVFFVYSEQLQKCGDATWRFPPAPSGYKRLISKEFKITKTQKLLVSGDYTVIKQL